MWKTIQTVNCYQQSITVFRKNWNLDAPAVIHLKRPLQNSRKMDSVSAKSVSRQKHQGNKQINNR